jgi:preprotein translocase subunit SecE
MGKKKIPTKFKQKAMLERQSKNQKAMLERQSKNRKAPASSGRKINWKKFLKKLPGKISKFLRDVVHELKRVTWPTKKEIFNFTIVVLVTMAFFAVILGIFDLVFLRLVELIKGL